MQTAPQTLPARPSPLRQGLTLFGVGLLVLGLSATAAWLLRSHLAQPASAPNSDQVRAALRDAGFVPVSVPRPAPPLALAGADGRITLAGLRGQPVLVHFWGTVCPACLAELPDLERLADKLAGQGLVVLCVCTDEPDLSRASRIARQHAGRLTVCTDHSGLAATRYDALVLPTSYLIDGEGRLLASIQGAQHWTDARIEALARALGAASGW